MQTGSRVSGTERLQALRVERALPARAGRERERQTKRERVISPHPASFLFKHESSFASRAFTPPFPLVPYYPSPLPLPLLLPIPFHFFFLLIMAHLISSPASPTTSITAEEQGRKKKTTKLHANKCN